MDDKQAFMELSALLTGLYEPLLNDLEDRELNKPVAEEDARQLTGTFPQEFPVWLGIVGSSVFTTSATANPTMTLAALALRTGAAIHCHMQGEA
jgi:hypothetical protein